MAALDGPQAEIARFEGMLQPVYGEAVRLAYGMLHDSALAEDAAQDAALRAWHHRASLRPGSDIRPWFLTIVANRCRDLRRSPWRRRVPLAEPAHASDQGPAFSPEIEDLRTALVRLSHRDRLIVVLRYYLDLPHEEVASVTGLSVPAVRARTSRALRRLRVELISEDGS